MTKILDSKSLENIDIDKVTSEGYSFQVEMNIKSHDLGFSIKEIPIIFNDRTSGSSKMSKKVIFEAIYMVPLLRIKKIFGLLQ